MCDVKIDSFKEELELDQDTLLDLYNSFIDELYEEKIKLESELKENSYKVLKVIIHNLKGISGNYKAVTLWDKSSEIHNKILENKFEDMDEMLIDLIKTIDDTISIIRLYFEGEE